MGVVPFEAGVHQDSVERVRFPSAPRTDLSRATIQNEGGGEQCPAEERCNSDA